MIIYNILIRDIGEKKLLWVIFLEIRFFISINPKNPGKTKNFLENNLRDGGSEAKICKIIDISKTDSLTIVLW